MLRLHLSPPNVGDAERAALSAAFEGGWIAPVGPELTAFEADVMALTGSPAAVALSSGTAALHLGLLGVGVRPGDEVLVSTFTFAASANAVTYCGARPVFIDSDPTSWNMDPQLLADELRTARASNRLPAAVMVVDLYGQCADFDPIRAECAELGIPIVEDAAEALGARYHDRHAGTLGDVGIFSFNGNKIVTTSGGGMLIAHDPNVVERARHLATQARQPAAHYEHAEVGFNYRLSNLLAALGRAQLARLSSFVERRRAINARYREALHDICDFMPVPAWSEWNGWLTCVVFDDPAHPATVMSTLAESGIESRPLWKPMHQQGAFAGCRSRTNGTSDHLAAHGLCLPSGSAMSDADVDEVADLIRRATTR